MNIYQLLFRRNQHYLTIRSRDGRPAQRYKVPNHRFLKKAWSRQNPDEDLYITKYAEDGVISTIILDFDSEDDIEKAYEEEKIKPNNYLQGLLGAFTFPIPGILVTILFFMLRRITAISGLVYYVLARKGYLWAGGKFNKIGVLIISGASVFYAVAGTFVGYVALIVKEFYKEFSAEGVSIFNIIKYAVKTVLDNPVVRHNLIVNIRLSLLFCGVCIIINMVQSLKQTEKTKVKKSS